MATRRALQRFLAAIAALVCCGAVSAQSVANAEIFFDNPAVAEGSGTPLTVTNDGVGSLVESFDTSFLSTGAHTAYLRFQDDFGEWSDPIVQPIVVVDPVPDDTVSEALGAGEYFLGSDPGQGAGQPLSLSADGAFATATASVDLSTGNGYRLLGVRLQDNSAEWSQDLIQATNRTVVAMDPVPPTAIVAGEYFLDSDPGEGAGSTLIVSADSAPEATASVDVRSTPGDRLLGLRVLDEFGEWSDPILQGLRVLPVGPDVEIPESVDRIEYYIDVDPGLDNGTELTRDPFYDPVFRITIGAGPMPTDPLTRTGHTIAIRVRDDSGEYSHDYLQGVDLRDSDDDGYIDIVDAFPNDPFEWFDTDGDGIGNNSDPDLDGDGLDNAVDPDDDNDGLPDDYELANGLDPRNPDDAQIDHDNDGLTTAEEYILGTDPMNPDTDGDSIIDGLDPTPLFPGVIDELPTPEEVDSEDNFGEAVAVSGDRLVVSAPDDEGGGTVFAYRIVGANFISESSFGIPAGFVGSSFGAALTMAGDRLFVGAPGVDPGTGTHLQGAFYERVGSSWVFRQALVGLNDGGLGQFGASAALDGDLLVVGAPRDNDGEAGLGSGAVYLYQFDTDQFVPLDKLKPTADPGGFFGTAVGVSGGRVAVGAPNRVVSGLIRGEVTLLDISGGLLTNPRLVTGSGSGSAALFGAALGLRGDLMVVGAPGEESNRGAVYVFNLTTGIMEIVRRTANETDAGDLFGDSVAFDGNAVIVGAPAFSFNRQVQGLGGPISGAVYYYSDPDSLLDAFRLEPLPGELGFGSSTALDGDRILMGAPESAGQGRAAIHRDVRLELGEEVFRSGFEEPSLRQP